MDNISITNGNRSKRDKIHVSVTKKHIEMGIRGSFDHCPVALAVKDALPGEYIIALITFLQIGRTQINCSNYITLWIRSFDQGNPMHPFKFTIDLGAKSAYLGPNPF